MPLSDLTNLLDEINLESSSKLKTPEELGISKDLTPEQQETPIIGGVVGESIEAVGKGFKEAGETFKEAIKTEEGKLPEVSPPKVISGAVKTALAPTKAIEPIVEPLLKGAEATLQFITKPLQKFISERIPEETREEILAGLEETVKGGIQEFQKLSPETQDIIKAGGESAELILTALGGREASKGIKEITRVGKKAGEKAIETGVKIAEKALAPPPVEKAIKKETENVFKAIKPRLTTKRNLKQVKPKMELAHKTIVEEGFVPKDLETYVSGIKDSKKKVWGQIEGRLKSAGVETEINFKEISDEIVKLADSPALQRANPKAIQDIKNFADQLTLNNKKLTSGVLEAEEVKQMLNAELNGLFGELNISKPLKEAKKKATSLIGKQLDNKLSKVEGEFQGLKNKYGALREIEDDAIKRLIVFERQSPESLFTGLGKLSGFADIAKGIISKDVSQVGRGLTSIVSGKLLKQANDANEIIKKAFGNIDKSIKKSPSK